MTEFDIKVLKLFQEDSTGLYWYLDKNENIRWYINCNDIFWWGTADDEQITPENIDILEKALEDSEDSGTLLFCARVRKMRPQGAFYKFIPVKEWDLFNACGPEREIDIGNPYTQHNEYKYKSS